MMCRCDQCNYQRDCGLPRTHERMNMKYYLITGKTPEIIGRDEQPFIAEQHIELPGGNVQIIPERPYSPAILHVPARDMRIEIGESNPLESSGKPFKVTFHSHLGIVNLEDWKRLIQLYGTRITHEFVITPDGVKQPNSNDESAIVPAHHLISLLNDGFSKAMVGDKLVYSKQKGRIEDESGKTLTVDEMLAILEP